MQPISVQERIPLLDILRGFALFGVLAANMAAYSQPFARVISEPEYWKSSADVAVRHFIEFFISGKFVSLFSLLFGVGFAVQMDRAEARGASGAAFFTRRMAVLLAIGWAHALLIWFGDILAPYALFGFLLLLFRRCRPATLLLWTALCLVLPTLVGAWLLPAGPAPLRDPARTKALLDQALHAYGKGSFREIMAARVAELWILYSVLLLFALRFFMMFLVGVYAWRRGVFQAISEHRDYFMKVMVWGLAIWVSCTAAAIVVPKVYGATPGWLNLLLQIIGAIAAPALGLFYASVIALLLGKGKGWLVPLAPLGRMALTNYLLQSVLATIIFYSYGFGLYGKVGPALCLLITMGIYSIQIPLSAWWLRRFRFGPAEWLWRSLTYGQAQPMRLEQPLVANA